jgi:hypothetical protein
VKYCPSCETEKEKPLFSKSSKRYDGLQSHCKSCRSSRRKLDYEKNKEKELSVNKAWANNNPDSVRKKAKNHRQSHSGKVYYRVKNAKRRAGRLNATPPWLSEDHFKQIKAVYAHAKECELLTGDKYHVDHIVPLQGANVCGLHVPWNLQVLPADINIAKSNRYGQ